MNIIDRIVSRTAGFRYKKIPQGTLTFDTTLTLEDQFDQDGNVLEWEVAVEATGYYDPGKTYGPPEDSYPPEGEFKVLSLTDKASGKALDPNDLTQDQLRDLEQEFFEKLESQREGMAEDAAEARDYDRKHGF
ncbi:MAG: hypothetical protein WC525_10385 [Candidatus Thermoplasmatota archaeon]